MRHPLSSDTEQNPRVEEALIGLSSWWVLAQAHGGQLLALPGGSVAVCSAALANGFQVGLLREGQRPFLAYTPDLGWFGQAWRGILFAAEGVVLIAPTAEPFALALPTDLPAAMTALQAAVRANATGSCVLTPFAETYLDSLSTPPGGPRHAVSALDHLTLRASTEIPILEPLPWLESLWPHLR